MADCQGMTEFYCKKECVTRLGLIVPVRVGELISIRKTTYEVASITWAIDYSEKPHHERVARCNVDLKVLRT